MSKFIGLVGESGAGKDTVAGKLQAKGMKVISLSTEVRRYAQEQGYTNCTRSDLQEIANEARRIYGPGFFAEQAVRHLDPTTDQAVFVGMRNLAEVEMLRNTINQPGQEGSFVMVAVVADPEVRFERISRRRDPSDPLTWEDFETCDKRESGTDSNEAHCQQNHACIEAADYRLVNNGTEKELDRSIDQFVHQIGLHVEGQTRSHERL